MKVEQKGHITIVKFNESSFEEFLEKLTAQYHSNQNTNLIIDVTAHKQFTLSNLKQFLTIVKAHKKNKKSFVVVAQNINFNEVPASINTVPTIQEAHDIIEMEEIERDLGF